MIIFELTGQEANPVYQALQISNVDRQYDFLLSIVLAALDIQKPFLSQTVIKALNFYAISCLHVNAGEYRPCQVYVGTHTPPEHFRVQALMDDFVNDVNRYWETTDPISICSLVLWRLNWIHPFINGNGRTARAACYYVLCLKAGGLLPGAPILPELIQLNRKEYVQALKEVDQSVATGSRNLAPLNDLLSRLVMQQLGSASAKNNSL